MSPCLHAGHQAVGVVDVLSLPGKQRTSARSLYFFPPSLVLFARFLHRSNALLLLLPRSLAPTCLCVALVISTDALVILVLSGPEVQAEGGGFALPAVRLDSLLLSLSIGLSGDACLIISGEDEDGGALRALFRPDSSSSPRRSLESFQAHHSQRHLPASSIISGQYLPQYLASDSR